MRPIFLFFVVLFFFSCHKGHNNPEACNGDNRRDVKLLTDALVPTLDTAVINTTVTALGEMNVPEVDGESPRQNVELKVYRVTAKVNKVKDENDGDVHVRLEEGDNYLITECPNPDCDYAAGSSYNNYFRQVADFIHDHDLEGKTVTITGVGFIDVDHHYKRKQAKNNFELHPILSISY